jgi:hypothetical protein
MKKTRIFSKTLQQLRTISEEFIAKPEKRGNTFSQSRDIREDRGERQMKTTHNPQTFPHGLDRSL